MSEREHKLGEKAFAHDLVNAWLEKNDGNWNTQDLIDRIHAARAQDAERIAELERALRDVTKRYVDLINSGDCGNWDPETEPEVIAARALLGLETQGEET